MSKIGRDFRLICLVGVHTQTNSNENIICSYFIGAGSDSQCVVPGKPFWHCTESPHRAAMAQCRKSPVEPGDQWKGNRTGPVWHGMGQSMWADRDRSGKRSGAGRKLSERERSGGGGVVERERSGERTKLAAQISLKGDMLPKFRNALQTLFKPCQKYTVNRNSSPMLFLNSELRYLWTASTLRQHTTECQ